jgi:hypothetical protein
MLKKLTKEDCNISIQVELDDTPIRGNAMASGDDSYDKEIEDTIINKVNDGNVWAWASVIVIAEWNGFKGRDHLGCCSYKNEDEFKSDGYYRDMVNSAVDDLNNTLSEVYKDMMPLKSSSGAKL